MLANALGISRGISSSLSAVIYVSFIRVDIEDYVYFYSFINNDIIFYTFTTYDSLCILFDLISVARAHEVKGQKEMAAQNLSWKWAKWPDVALAFGGERYR